MLPGPGLARPGPAHSLFNHPRHGAPHSGPADRWRAAHSRTPSPSSPARLGSAHVLQTSVGSVRRGGTHPPCPGTVAAARMCFVLALTVSLLCVGHALALPAYTRTAVNRLALRPRMVPHTGSSSVPPSNQPVSSQDPRWRRDPPRFPAPHPIWTQLAEASRLHRRSPRSRRHAHAAVRGGHHYPRGAQLLRVGCVLGTCQVQNLSHRLYQLIGQSGREESSPINPKSPHSYG